jgi:hypothetical protein
MKYFKILFLGILLSFSFNYGQTIDRSIISDSDDAEERASDTGVELTSTDMDLGTKRVGLRFTNITIPQGATITNAYIQFTADENETGEVSLRIRGNDVDDAVTFSSTDGDVFTNRAKTTANVIWTPGDWSIGNSGAAQRTPDISSVVQEIIDRGGWSSGNSIAFMITSTTGYDGNERAADSHEQGTPAQLHIEYTEATEVVKTLGAGSDDAEEHADGSMELTSVDLDLATKLVGLRFTNIAIPQGATITNAYIQFTADENETGEVSLRIRGNDVDDASTFSTTNSDISGRVQTAASVDWAPDEWSIGNSGAAQRTPDISSVVQEIIARNGWTSGNSMAFMIASTNGYNGNERAADSHEEGVGAELHISYTEGGATSNGVISSGDLTIEIENLGNGIKLAHLQRNGTELLNTSSTNHLVTLNISDNLIGSLNGWNNVNMVNNGSILTIELSSPTNTSLFPSTLVVTITISVDDGEARWDLSVEGLNNKSLLSATFPRINILADGSDHFLIPHAAGQEIDNPKASAINSELLYPRGSAATMQFSAYYNDNYGIYLGTHDPSASMKTFRAVSRSGGIECFNIFSPPNKTVNGNDWEMPGYFSLEFFDGNWYEAAKLYKDWVSSEAKYWPQTSTSRTLRQNNIGSIGAWAYLRTKDTTLARNEIEGYQNMIGVPVGIRWYDWSQNIDGIDENYPKFLPEINGMTEIVQSLEAPGNVYIVPYTNARLYDVSLNDYSTNGEPYAVKDINGNVETQNFTGNTFAVMCPTQTSWQNTLINIQDDLTNRIGANGIYLDQVCHAMALECYDASHGHPIGGGSLWKDGYDEVVKGIRNTVPSSVFITSEGAQEFLHNQLDGSLTLAWNIDNLVPAYPVVYAGKIQTYGISMGTSEYDAVSFYCKLATIFNFGIQIDGIPTSIYADSRSIAVPARAYIKEIANLRYKLREFMSFGTMLKPIIDVSGIPTITSDWLPGSGVRNVTISTLQQSIWKNDDDDKLLIVLANASKTSTLSNITIDIVGTDYGLSGDLSVQRIREGNNDSPVTESNHFVRTVSLAPKEIYAIVLESSLAKKSAEEINKPTYKLEQNYPNPFNPSTVISFSLAKAGNTKIEIYNILGQRVATLLNKELGAGSHKVKFNGSNLSSGIYFYRLQSDNYSSIKKMILLK